MLSKLAFKLAALLTGLLLFNSLSPPSAAAEDHGFLTTSTALVTINLTHQEPIGPHWDYRDPTGQWHRIYPDNRKEPKK